MIPLLQALQLLEESGHLVFTPSLEVEGRRFTPYDDRYVLDYALAHGGVVVSRDCYRDILQVEKTILTWTRVNMMLTKAAIVRAVLMMMIVLIAMVMMMIVMMMIMN